MVQDTQDLRKSRLQITEGSVIWWSEKGYGKILGDDEVEYFFHYKGVEKKKGDRINFDRYERVKFVATENGRGPLAINVTKDSSLSG